MSSQIRSTKSEARNKMKLRKLQFSKREAWASGFGHLNFDHCSLPFGVAQGGESFDVTQDPEVLEGLVEPFRISKFGFC